eukprot:133350-Amphidinium_carterae.1
MPPMPDLVLRSGMHEAQSEEKTQQNDIETVVSSRADNDKASRRSSRKQGFRTAPAFPMRLSVVLLH